MGEILDTKEENKHYVKKLKEQVLSLQKAGVVPRLVVYDWQKDADSSIYSRMLEKKFDQWGLLCTVRRFSDSASAEEVYEQFAEDAKDPSCHGILPLYPLPDSLDRWRLEERIPPKKDVDGLGSYHLAQWMSHRTPKEKDLFFSNGAVASLLRFCDCKHIALQGKHVTLLGSGRLLGKPLGMALLQRGATVTWITSKSESVREILALSDIVVVAVGKAEYFDRSYFSPHHIVLDLGSHQSGDRIVGDTARDVPAYVSRISAVPGGISRFTTTILAEHVLRACILQEEEKTYE